MLDIVAGYLYFYNPIRLAALLLRKKTSEKAAVMQLVGMLGLTQSIRRTSGWALRLMFGRIERLQAPPASPIPMRSNDGARACHEPVEVTVTVQRPRQGRAVSLPVAG